MFKDKMKIINNRNTLSIFISLLIFAFVFSISWLDFLNIVNKRVLSLYFDKSKPISNNIMIVEIDEDTVAWRKLPNWTITEKWLGRFPFDRKYFAKVIDNLNNAWATVIALDVIFWEESNEQSDNILSESIKNAWNVILWVWSDSSWYVQFPYSKFWDYTLSKWFYSVNIEEASNIVYSIIPFRKFQNSELLFNHFSIAILRWFYSKIYNDDDYLSKNFVFTKDKIILNDKVKLFRSSYNSNDVLINYAPSHRFYKKSFLDIYNWDFNKAEIKDKIVIIWATAEWIKDVFETPIWSLYWVYLHANLINTVITDNWIVYINIYLELLLLYLFILMSVYFNVSRSSYVLIFSNISIIGLFIILIYYITWFTNFIFHYFVEFILAVFISLAFSNIVKYYIENKHKTKLNKALSEYVSEDVANEILSWAWLVNLNWEKKEIAIFFSDIQWFTSISEKLSPEELVSFLREYLGEMSNIIMSDKWYIDKYEWDAIMALWWVFWVDELSTYSICKSALLQQKKLIELNNLWKDRWLPEIKARIWMHYWSAVVWDIWSEWWKKNFTALWDNVNLASRLEWVNKFYGTFICASEAIFDLQKENFEFRYLDKIRVKWKAIPIKIYELLWIKWEVSEDKIKMKQEFEEATRLYLNREFSSAKEIFQNLLSNWDNAPRLYLDMCEIYLKTPPPADWDWVSEMLSK